MGVERADGGNDDVDPCQRRREMGLVTGFQVDDDGVNAAFSEFDVGRLGE